VISNNRRENRVTVYFRSGMVGLAAAALLAGALPAQAAPAGRPAPTAVAHPLLVDRVAAIVNRDVITQSEFEAKLQQVIGQMQQQGTPLPDRKTLASQVMEHMIMDHILLQRAKADRIKVDEGQVTVAMEAMAAHNHLTLPDFQKAVAKHGMNYDMLASDVRNELIINQLRKREVLGRIHVSDREVDNFLNGGRNTSQQEYQLAHIMIRLPAAATPQQVEARQARAAAALAALKAGKPFSQVAASYSDAGDALRGGELGWQPSSELPDLFLQALATLKPNGVSGILRSPNGFHIIKLENVRTAAHQAVAVEKTHARHILIKTSDVVSDQEARAKLERIRTRLLQGADFAQLAKLDSQDTSAAQGGDLGWIAPGETVPEFERAMNALKPGEISPPVKSQFGWHLIQVLERRQFEASDADLRDRARQAIGMRKAEEAYQQWLRELRDEAYVENHLNEL
jgi:peptidyl-prolyl cis-trans isomerase SurA